MGSGTVIASVVVATGLTSLRHLLQGNVTVLPVIGGFIVGTFLLIVGMASSELAAALALLLLITSILVNAGSVLEKVSA